MNRRNLFLYGLIFLTACSRQKEQASLVPDTPSRAPDYFCTWNVQGYRCSYSTNAAQRQAMNQDDIFGDSLYQNWISLWPKLHQDLYFLLDDSWDVPLDGNKNYFGSLIVDTGRFAFTKGQVPEAALTTLAGNIKRYGWKGVGLWVCAQQAPAYIQRDSVAYWRQRMEWMKKAGVSYWKVDWGENGDNAAWRLSLTGLAKEYAPGLVIEHAITPSLIDSCQLYRTYDVENIIAVPHTIDRVGKLLSAAGEGSVSIINCEDEPYIAAGLGCSIAIERHPFRGKLPNGAQDFVFPPVGRDLKNRLDEVTRCVRWHRIAEPFPIGKTSRYIDTMVLTDHWVMGKDESWRMDHPEGMDNSWQAPAIICRGLEKPLVKPGPGELPPYILASKYPNGAIAIAALGRTTGREYITPRADVLLNIGTAETPIGVFGRYHQLTFQCQSSIPGGRVWAQDLAGDKPVDITDRVTIRGNQLIIPGALIDEIGCSAASAGDVSEPGLVLAIKK